MRTLKVHTQGPGGHWGRAHSVLWPFPKKGSLPVGPCGRLPQLVSGGEVTMRAPGRWEGEALPPELREAGALLCCENPLLHLNPCWWQARVLTQLPLPIHSGPCSRAVPGLFLPFAGPIPTSVDSLPTGPPQLRKACAGSFPHTPAPIQWPPRHPGGGSRSASPQS